MQPLAEHESCISSNLSIKLHLRCENTCVLGKWQNFRYYVCSLVNVILVSRQHFSTITVYSLWSSHPPIRCTIISFSPMLNMAFAVMFKPNPWFVAVIWLEVQQKCTTQLVCLHKLAAPLFIRAAPPSWIPPADGPEKTQKTTILFDIVDEHVYPHSYHTSTPGECKTSLGRWKYEMRCRCNE